MSLARLLPAVLVGMVGLSSVSSSAETLDVERLAPSDSALLRSTLQHLEPLISAKKQDGSANLLTWEELYQPLAADERRFLDEIRAIKAETLGATSHYFGESAVSPPLVQLGPQQILKNGAPSTLDKQFLPEEVAQAYGAMTQAMERHLGRRLLVESGYRSPAYQLYLFMFYLPSHEDSIRETNRHVALPGYSEHGNPRRQAIDFINQEGINGEEHPEIFEALPEYAWLQQHAAQFGFHLSYPRDNPSHTAFEPWHWHYETSAQ